MGIGIKGRPPMLVLASAALAAEAVALAAYTVYNVIDLATRGSRTAANGAALIVIQVIIITGLLLMARGVLNLRPWTRTPGVMAQILVGVLGWFLLEAHQYAGSAIALILAVAGLVGFLTPASLKALARPMPGDDSEPAKKPVSGKSPASGTKPASPKSPAGKPARNSGNPAKRNPAGKPGNTSSRR